MVAGGTKLFIAIGLISCLFIPLLCEAQIQTIVTSREADYKITTAERNWLLIIDYIANVKYQIKGEEVETIWRADMKPTVIDTVLTLYPKKKYSLENVTAIAIQAVATWIEYGKKLSDIRRAATPEPELPQVPELPDVDAVPSIPPKTDLLDLNVFIDTFSSTLNTDPESFGILYLVLCVTTVLAMAIMGIKNPLWFIVGLIGVSAGVLSPTFAGSSSLPLFIPVSIIVLFVIVLFLGGKK